MGEPVTVHTGSHDSDARANGARRRSLGLDETSVDAIASIFIAKIDFDLT